MKAVLLTNPSSGKKSGEAYALYAQEKFQEAGWQCEIRLTQKESDIADFTRYASETEADRLIIIGGDGTVSKVLNTLNQMANLPVIGIIPTGTVNNVAKGMGLQLPVENVVDQLIQSKIKACDVGEVNGRLFLSSLSSGTVPATVWTVSDEMKEKYGSLAYFMEGLRALKDEEPYTVRVDLDGQSFTRQVSLMLIGVSHSISGIPHFFEKAHMDDGRLYMLLIDQTSIREKLHILSDLLRDDIGVQSSHAVIKSFEQAHIVIENKPMYAAMDGEKGPAFPLEVNVRPGFVRALIPVKREES
nr:diacylglycerol kinase family protein [Alkalibacterium sp. AK22]